MDNPVSLYTLSRFLYTGEVTPVSLSSRDSTQGQKLQVINPALLAKRQFHSTPFCCWERLLFLIDQLLPA